MLVECRRYGLDGKGGSSDAHGRRPVWVEGIALLSPGLRLVLDISAIDRAPEACVPCRACLLAPRFLARASRSGMGPQMETLRVKASCWTPQPGGRCISPSLGDRVRVASVLHPLRGVCTYVCSYRGAQGPSVLQLAHRNLRPCSG